MNFIYLDNAATTKPFNQVNEAIIDCNKNFFGNPSSLHRLGIDAEEKLESARAYIAKYIGSNIKEVIFTSGGTESINTAIKSYLNANKHSGSEIVTSDVEHMATYNSIKSLEEKKYNIKYVKSNSFGIDLNMLENSINNNTSLVSIIHVNNESGVINPIKKIYELVKRKNQSTVVHFDTVQSFGKLNLKNISRYSDFISVSSHKLHGPKGVGFLYINENLKISPIIDGGGQEFNIRSGTVNVPLIHAFKIASNLNISNQNNNFKKINFLKEYLIEKLQNSDLDFKINFAKNTSPYILSVSFKGVKSEVLLHYLEANNIYVSTSSACSSKKNQNRVLENYNMNSDDIDGTIRISFSIFNTKNEIDVFYDTLCKIVPKIKY